MNKNKKDSQDAEVIVDLDKLSEEQQIFLNEAIVADAVYEVVISNLHIPADSPAFHAFITGILKQRTKDHIIGAIWKNITPDQLEHFNSYLNSSAVTNPEAEHEGLLVDFALMYPELMKSVHKSLGDFFRDFIAQYNKLHDA